MKNIPLLFKDTIIILFIILVFICVFLVIYTEVIKNNDIRSAKNNFFFVKDEIFQSINDCGNNESKSWVFGGPCSLAPKKENISQYFNTVKKLINPYDNSNGVEGVAGSVLIKLRENQFILSVDINANGGIDIEQKLNFQ